MDFKRIFKRGKKKKLEGEGQASPSRVSVPSPDASVRNASPPPGSAVAVSALVFQPFVPLPIPPSELRQTETAVGNAGSWTNLAAFVDLLHQTAVFTPLAAVIDHLSWFVRVHEDVICARHEYRAIRTQLEALFQDLRVHFSASTPPAMTTSMLSLCEAIQNEIHQVYDTRDKSTISRCLQAESDLDKITECYRRIQGHLERVILNASLNIWKTVDRQAAETQLGKLNPSLSAYYDSAEANTVQRRECAANTREKVLLDLQAWKDSQHSEKVCWINGMAGTGKTTIVNTLCSTLDNKHELGASFFCTRLIPTCRDVKFILPTIAYQLARFSSPFRGALLQVLEQDPDVYSKVPRVQFKRMILEPLQQVVSSLPSRIVVVIDALDECDDGSGVEQILEMLLENAPNLPIKFLVSSRPEHHIRDRIRRSALKTQLILHELDAKTDIEIYLRVELASISVPFTEGQLAVLVERAGSLFIYAATVIRYINGGDTLDRLATVLEVPDPDQEPTNQTKEIDQLYEAVLISALENAKMERSEKRRMQLVLNTIVCAQEPLTVDALAGLLNLRRTQVMAGLKPLWSVLHISESNTSYRVSTLHASFPDYILDLKRSKRFACDSQAHNGKLAELCLKRIERNPSQFNICNLQSSFVFDADIPDFEEKRNYAIPLDLLYACQYWGAHLSLSTSSDNLITMLHGFFEKRVLLWIEVLNLATQIHQGVEQMGMAVIWLQTTGRSESILLLAKDTRRFITMFATSPVSRSTPHLYISMLSSWPENRPIAHYYSQKATGLVKLKGIEKAERQLGLLSLIPAGSDVRCVSYSSDGRFFAACTWEHGIIIWDAGSCRMTIDPIIGHSDSVQAIAISPDGTRICSGSHDETVRIWDTQNGQLVAGPLEGHQDHIWSVNYSPDGQLLASGSVDGIVCIWSTNTWERKSLIERDGAVHSTMFSLDSTMVAAGFGSAVHLLDPFSGQGIGDPLNGHTEFVRSLAFLPDGKHLASGSDDHTICVWDINIGEIVFGPFRQHTDSVSDIRVSPDGCFLVSAGEDNTIQIWNIQTWQSRILFRNAGIVRSIRFSPDGLHLVSGSSDGNVRIWEVEGFSDEQMAISQLEGHGDWIRSVSFSPCGTYIVSGSDDATVCIWGSQSKQLMHSPLTHTHRILFIGVSADSEHIFSVSEDRMIHVWNNQTEELEYAIGPVETDNQYDVLYQENWPAGFLFDGRRVVCGSKSGLIYMQDDDKPSFALTKHSHPVYSIAFSPDGKSFASGSTDGIVMIWDTSTGEGLFDPFKGHSGDIYSIAFSPDGTQLASGSRDRTIRLWSTITGTPAGGPFVEHTNTVRSVAFSPSGKQLVSGSRDMSLRVWDIASGQSIAVFEGHADVVLSAAFSPDGTQIVSGSADKTIRLWDAPVQCISSPSYVACEVPQERLANGREGDLSLKWDMDKDGWLRDPQNRLLLWVLPDLRSILLRRNNSGLISRQGCIKLEFTGARIGDEWVTCYKPL